MKDLLQELGYAINEAVGKSARVDTIMQAIRDSGYEVYMTLEANIAVQEKNEQLDDQLTSEDRSFLKRLRIEC